MHFLDYFNPVKVIPFVKFFDKNINITSSGKQDSTLIANCSGYGVKYTPEKSAIAWGIVLISGEEIIISGHKSKFHTHCEWNIISANIAVFAIGTEIFQKILNSDAPSILADSIISSGIE